MKSINPNEYQLSVLRHVVNHFIPIPESIIDEVFHEFKLVEYEKNTDFIVPGDTIKNVYFILNGLVRIHYIKEFKDITVVFKSEHTFFTNSNYLYGHLDNFYYYSSLEKTVCLYIDYDNLEKLYQKYHILERLGRKIVEYNYISSLQSNENLLYLSAEERYLTFCKTNASLFQRVQLKYIASYLGLTQETLSRLRAKYPL